MKLPKDKVSEDLKNFWVLCDDGNFGQKAYSENETIES